MNPLNSAIAIGAGGFCGALLRFWVSTAVKNLLSEQWAFVGTVAVNLAGCFLIGALLVLYAEQLVFSPLTFQFLLVGLLGSLTTFSTFAAESLELLREGRFGAALLHVGTNIIVGIALVAIGAFITERLLPASGEAR